MSKWGRVIQVLIGIVVMLGVHAAWAAEQGVTRSLPEIKKEVQTRAEKNRYPAFGLKPDDVRETLARINTTAPDEWGTEWMKTGDRYFAKAKAEESVNPDAARDDYLMAYRYYMFGRWPVPSSQKKAESYAKSMTSYANYTRLEKKLRLEVVRIPFEGTELVGLLQKPLGPGKPPILINIGGVDFWKEDMLSASQALVDNGVATFNLDMPGTGQAPLPLKPGSERIFSAAIDYLLTRSDLDGSRIVVRGISFGSYWALRAAYREVARLKGVVYHSAPVHNYFQREWVEKRGLVSSYYLFDYVQSRLFITRTKTVEELLDFMPSLSLVTEGLVSKPTPPMLIVAGVKDPQAPWADALILLKNGSAKEAWVNPAGTHMGRTATFDEEAIMDQVVHPWIFRTLGIAK